MWTHTVDSNATWHGNVHFWGYFREYTTKIASTHKTPIVALRDILTEIILFAGGIIVRCSPKPASGPEVGLWRPSCTRAMQGMCGVLPTPPHTFACVPGLVSAQPRTILMRGAQGAPTSQPQQLDLASRREGRCVEHCQMSARGGGMPPQSRAVTCIDSPDLAGHRLSSPDWPIHLDQLPASRGACGATLQQQKGTSNVAAPAGLRGGRTPQHMC